MQREAKELRVEGVVRAWFGDPGHPWQARAPFPSGVLPSGRQLGLPLLCAPPKPAPSRPPHLCSP